MVFQENNLFAHLDVEDNVGLAGRPRCGWRLPTGWLLRKRCRAPGSPTRNAACPENGGERQRVAWPALVRNRPVLLLDEPFGSLGPALREDMLDLLVGVQEERRMTVLFVTHQPEEARRVTENIIFLEDGMVAATGPTPDFFAKDGPEAFRRYIGSFILMQITQICPEADIIQPSNE